jgi:hypothetical protein
MAGAMFGPHLCSDREQPLVLPGPDLSPILFISDLMGKEKLFLTSLATNLCVAEI